MAWFGEGLSTLKGQIQHFTKEVLTEGREELNDSASILNETQHKVEELEALCATQDSEITALRQQNAELLSRLKNFGQEAGDGDGSASTWWTVEQRCDTAYNNGVQNGSSKQQSPGWSSSEKEQQQIQLLQVQLEQLEKDKQQISMTCASLEEQLNVLSEKHHNEMTGLQDQLQLAQSREGTSLKEQLQDSEKRVEELEGHLQQVQQQLWDHLNTTQTSANEIRSEVEHSRWQLLQESGAQKTELLRARQDMVNRIIQMGEKSREVEMNMKKLKVEGQHLSADIAAIIHKLGDPEQQELIHGALNALELENQVLKLRNSQLELNVNKGNTSEISHEGDENKSISSDLPDYSSKYFDVGVNRAEDDFDTMSVKSDFSELSAQKQKLEAQLQQLKSQVDVHKRDIKHYEMLKLDWSERDSLEKRLSDVKEQLRDKEESLNLITAQKGLLSLKRQSPEGEEELSAKHAKVVEERDLLLLTKTCMQGEVQAMARVVQDLEAQLAREQEEKTLLSNSLVELDSQHQDALDQLLSGKKLLQSQNETLKFEIMTLKQQLEEVQKEVKQKLEENGSVKVDIESQTEDIDNSALYENFKEEYKVEFDKKLLKLLTFEIPKDYHNKSGSLVEALAKLCTEWKWKKDTLERKVAELLKEGRDAEMTITKLRQERDGLRNNVESLVEELMGFKSSGAAALAPIPEGSEERIATLESEVDVLKEARSNLEAETARFREEGQSLIAKLRNLEAMLRNQENLEMEVSQLQKLAVEEQAKYEAALQTISNAATEAETLTARIAMLESTVSRLEELRDANQEAIAGLEGELQSAKEEDKKHRTRVNKLEALVANHESSVQVKVGLEMRIEEMQAKIVEAREIELTKSALQEKLEEMEKKLQHSEVLLSQQEALQADLTNWKDLVTAKEQEMQEILETKRELEKNYQSTISSLNHQLEITASIEGQNQQLQIINKQKSAETDSLKALITAKDQELNETLQKLSNSTEQYQALISLQAEVHAKTVELEKVLKENIYINQQLDASIEAKNQICKDYDELSSRFKQKEQHILELQNSESNLEQSLKEVHLKYQQEAVRWQAQAESHIKNQELLEQLITRVELKEGQLVEAMYTMKQMEEERDELKLQLQEYETSKQEAQLSNESAKLDSPLLTLHRVLEQLNAGNTDVQVQQAVSQAKSYIEEICKTFGKEALQQDDKDLDDSENSHITINSLQNQLASLQEERETLLTALNERFNENKLMREDNERLLELLTSEKAAISDLQEERNKLRTNLFQDAETSLMAKETINNLSKIIKDKDMEIEATTQKYDALVRSLPDDGDEVNKLLMKLQTERDELIRTVQVKHQESVQYHSEIQRLSLLLNQQLAKSEQQLEEQPAGETTVDGANINSELAQQHKDLQEECARLSESLKQAQAKIKYLESEVQDRQDKELERLRLHLVAVEESYTLEALKAEEKVKDLQGKLLQAEERIKNSSTVYTSASIRANQQVETLQGQGRLIAQQRDEVQQKLSAAEDQVHKHMAALRNLQVVLEQFQKDKEREISAATQKVYQQVMAAEKKEEELQEEITSLRVQLCEAKEGLSAAARLGEQLDKKTDTINLLRREVTALNTRLSEAEEKAKSADLSVEGKIDRYLAKNVVLGYFLAPAKSRGDVLRVVATVLGFSEEERARVGLHPAGPAEAGKKESLSLAFVRFLESESQPQPQLRFSPEMQASLQTRSTTPDQNVSRTSSPRPSPLLLSEVHLPAFGQFPVSRNSVSILKDVLKDS